MQGIEIKTDMYKIFFIIEKKQIIWSAVLHSKCAAYMDE